jgi:hypothetical protein
MLDAMCCANVLDIQTTLQKVAKAVLAEAGQPKAALKARAAALKELASIFQLACVAQEPKQVGRAGASWRGARWSCCWSRMEPLLTRCCCWIGMELLLEPHGAAAR